MSLFYFLYFQLFPYFLCLRSKASEFFVTLDPFFHQTNPNFRRIYWWLLLRLPSCSERPSFADTYFLEFPSSLSTNQIPFDSQPVNFPAPYSSPPMQRFLLLVPMSLFAAQSVWCLSSSPPTSVHCTFISHLLHLMELVIFSFLYCQLFLCINFLAYSAGKYLRQFFFNFIREALLVDSIQFLKLRVPLLYLRWYFLSLFNFTI